jgi:hypothetical protein
MASTDQFSPTAAARHTAPVPTAVRARPGHGHQVHTAASVRRTQGRRPTRAPTGYLRYWTAAPLLHALGCGSYMPPAGVLRLGDGRSSLARQGGPWLRGKPGHPVAVVPGAAEQISQGRRSFVQWGAPPPPWALARSRSMGRRQRENPGESVSRCATASKGVIVRTSGGPGVAPRSSEGLELPEG